MKKHFFYLLAVAMCLLAPDVILAQVAGTGQNTLRIMSYNVRNGKGMDLATDLDRVAVAINRIRPDVVAVQELDSATARSQGVDVLRCLAEQTLMHRVYGPAIPFDGGKYGTGILSREKPMATYSLPLPGREEQRVLLVAEFERYILACTHLSLTEADRMASLQLIRQEAAKAHKPFVLAGDLNARPDSPFISALQADFMLLNNPKKPTFPSDEPRECIDYIALYKPGSESVTLLAGDVADEPMASDHRPVWVDVRFRADRDAIFRSQPYLQNPTGGGITVMWQTTVPSYSWVEYGIDTLHLQRARTLVEGQVICNDVYNKIRLEGLLPGQTYYYRVCSREIMLYQAYKKVFGETAVSSFRSFTLPSEQTTDFTAVIFNDLHKQEATLKALYAQVKDVPYDFVVFNGDCIDDPATEEEALFHLSMQCSTVGADRVPVFYLRGNHEIRNAFSIGLRNLLDYVGDKTYGAFSWGDTRLVMLDCGEDKPDTTWVYYDLNDFTGLRLEQVDFLKQELASPPFTRASRRILLNHIPLYGNSDAYRPCSQLWGPLLDRAPFDVNISAHTHRYAYLPKGTAGNNFPVLIGGSQQVDGATVMILRKKGDRLTLRMLNAAGEVLHKVNL